MREFVFDAMIWWSGALLWGAGLVVLSLALAWGAHHAFVAMTERFLKICRLQRAQYWYQQFERLGWVRPELEYRRLVRRQPPANLRDFQNLQDELEKREQSRAREEGSD